MHDSLRTAQAYINSIRRFILFQGKHESREMGRPVVAAFLNHLAVQETVNGRCRGCKDQIEGMRLVAHHHV